ncbi:MAG: carboxypeptidase regulatory-like domain-containing protein [Bacteroidales bacterium]|nr:carboxypeptidase regulatory-like domain-containing protein [Bacteroidales bacterium]
MKSIRTLLLILVSFISVYSFSQERKEYYFSFPIQSRDEISSITKLISIDNVRNDTVWAYANPDEFVRFARKGYDITLLPHPGYNPGAVMNDNPFLAPATTWNFYPTYTAYEGYMNGFASGYPSICQVSTIATLTSGRKLMVVKISDNVATDENEPEFLYTSSIHGDETTGYILMMHLIDYLLSNYGTDTEVTDLVNNVEIYINPLANPDGTYAGGNTTVSGATRANANGVDMNRNYPDPQDGDHPDGNAWQPETIAFMDFASQHHFVSSCNFHGGAEVVNYPWDTWATLSADDDWWVYVSAEYADTAQIHAPSGYMTDVTASGYSNGFAWYEVDGGRQDYMNYFQRCREITIEVSSTKNPAASSLPSYWDYNWRSLLLYIKEARYGIHGTITSQATGLPLAAKVTISLHDNNNSEVYSSSNLGDYHRPVKAGTYTLQFSAANYQTQTISGVAVSDHATTTLNVQLVPNMVTTTAVTAVTMTSAASGGNVISDGGSPITARGVCWATTANPVATGLHTTDGTGTGAFTSSITGLSSSTLYHVRAYATNANGTFYGDDLTFTTTCGIVSTFPWNEGFENAGTIPNCWSQEQVNSSGLNWTFITGNGGTAPSTAHGGTYNACLKDATATDNITKLITPSLNLSGLGSPTLTFWHYMRVWSTDQDKLIVYYKTSATGTWTQLVSYTASVASWTQRTITLPNTSSDYYIAFEGNAKYGYGVCIDDVSITGSASPTLSVAPANQNVTAASGSTLFTVTSNSSWTASSDQSWCTVTSTGSGNASITATYQQNTTSTQRVANVTVTVTGLTPVVVTVTQAAPALSVTPSSQQMTAAAGSAGFSVNSNTVWTASSDQTWCTLTYGGNGNGSITANCTQNTSLTSRTANITVSAPGAISVAVTVVQAAPTLSVTPANRDVINAAGVTTFAITSNSSWTISSDAGWCTGPTSGIGDSTAIFAYTQNTTITVRVATLTVTVSGLAPVQVTMTQAAGVLPQLSASPSSQSVTGTSGNTSFTVTSNTSWTASSDQSWCTVPASGSGNSLLTATYTANPLATSRTAAITLTANGASPVTVTVIQAAPLQELNYTCTNLVQTSPTTFEFDLLLLDMDATLPFELATVQAGLTFNPAMYNGGTISASIVPSSSTLNASQQPTSVTFTQSQNCLKLAAKTPPGAGSGSIISTNPASPSRLCRIKITNTASFTTSSDPNPLFCFTTIPYPTKISQYLAGINTAFTLNSLNCFTVIQPAILLNPPPSLNVSPTNQVVLAAAGSAGFVVSCNASWSVVSDQAWCTISPGSGFGSGNLVATYQANTSSSQRVASLTFNVPGLSPQIVTVTQEGVPFKTLNVNFLLEGLFAGSGQMNPAMDENGIHWGATIADKVTLELHDESNYNTLVYSVSNVDLLTDGSISISLPSSYSGSYYLSIHNRNSIETASATAISFAGSTITYNFDLDTKAFGSNLAPRPGGYWAIYSGDVNQDGLIDSSDMISVDNDAGNFSAGYMATDLNGDGLVDSGDMILLDNNAANFISTVHP